MSMNQIFNNSSSNSYITSAMNKVYNYMFAGVLATGLVSFIVSTLPKLQMLLLTNPLKWIVILAPLACVLLLSFKFDKLSTGVIALLFGLVVVTFGVSLSTIFMMYTGGTIAAALFSSSIIFLLMSIYGHVTKRDLSSWRQFLMIGLIGLIISQIVNLFIQSSALVMALSAFAVILFTLLTAYDTQKIKGIMASANANNIERFAIMGALNLYLDFLNLFVSLLQLFGGGSRK